MANKNNTNNNNLIKLADLFENDTNKELFKDLSLFEESKKLHILAGKLSHKASKTETTAMRRKLNDAARLILMASDILKS